MNEPKRLITEFQSPLGRELLRAAAAERVPDDVRMKMASYLIGPGAAFERAQELAGPQASATHQPAMTAGRDSVLAQQGTSSLTSALGLKAGAALMIAGVFGGLGYLRSAPSGSAPLAASATPESAAQVTAHSAGGSTKIRGMRDGAPVENGAVPVENGAVPVENGAVPVENGAVPVENGAVPVENGAVPEVTGAATPSIRSTREVAANAVSGTSERESTRASRALQSKVAPRRLAAEPTQSADRAADLDGELRLLDAARRAIVNGQVDTARAYLKDYQRTFPQGNLKAEAAALLRRCALAE
jgi:TolA-binding protein